MGAQVFLSIMLLLASLRHCQLERSPLTEVHPFMPWTETSGMHDIVHPIQLGMLDHSHKGFFRYKAFDEDLIRMGKTGIFDTSSGLMDKDQSLIIVNGNLVRDAKHKPYYDQVTRKLVIPGCTGDLYIRLTYTQFTTTCAGLRDITLRGPFELKVGNSTELMQGSPLCDTNSEHPNAFSDDCTIWREPFVHMILSLLIIATLVLLAGLRVIVVRKIATPRGFTRMTDSGPFIGGIVNFHKTPEGLVRRLVKTEETELEDVEFRKRLVTSTRRTMTFSLKKIMMATFLGLTIALDPTEAYLEQMHQASIGDRFHYGQSEVLIVDALQMFPLEFVYYTGVFSAKMTDNWYCHHSDCDSPTNCDHYGPLGVWESNHMEKCYDTNDSICANRHFCQRGTTGCFASAGCLRWNITYQINVDSFYRVFRVGQSRDVISLNISSMGESPVKDVRLTNHYDHQGSTIVLNKNHVPFICHDTDRSLSPTPSRLGDIQISFNRSFHISWQQSSCRAQPEIGPICDTIKPFSENLERVCTKLPETVGEYSLSVTDGYLTSRRDNNVRLVVDTELIQHQGGEDSECQMVNSELIGVRGGPNPFKLYLTASIARAGTSTEFFYSCGNIQFMVPCDGRPHPYAVSSIDLCGSSPNVKRKSIIDQDYINLQGKLTLRSIPGGASQPGWMEYIKFPGIREIIGTFGVIGTVILCGILLLLCRK